MVEDCECSFANNLPYESKNSLYQTILVSKKLFLFQHTYPPGCNANLCRQQYVPPWAPKSPGHTTMINGTLKIHAHTRVYLASLLKLCNKLSGGAVRAETT